MYVVFYYPHKDAQSPYRLLRDYGCHRHAVYDRLERYEAVQ